MPWPRATRRISVPRSPCILNEDSVEFANEYKAREVITKYCSFMPVEIYLYKAERGQEYETIDASEVTEKDVVVETHR